LADVKALGHKTGDGRARHDTVDMIAVELTVSGYPAPYGLGAPAGGTPPTSSAALGEHDRLNVCPVMSVGDPPAAVAQGTGELTASLCTPARSKPAEPASTRMAVEPTTNELSKTVKPGVTVEPTRSTRTA
jgi:hypothetical protein